MTQLPVQDSFSKDELHDIALLALLVAHGTDADLDPREIDAIADRLLVLESGLSGDDVIVVFREAAQQYAGLKIVSAEGIVAELAESLDKTAKRQAFALLRAVAEADGVIHPMESTLLRHIAEAWDIGPAFVNEGATGTSN